MSVESDKYETSDYMLASFLTCLGHRYAVKRLPSGKVLFLFSIDLKLRDSIDKWVKNEPVPVRNFIASMDLVKNEFGQRR